MKKYHSGYFLTYKSKKFTASVYSKELIPESKLKLLSANYKGDNWGITWGYNNKWQGLEFIIIADSFEIAQNVLFNVLCSATVFDGTAFRSDDIHYPHELGKLDNVKGIITAFKPIKGYSSLTVPQYFYMAAKASKNGALQNSIIKYQLSTELYSRDLMDLNELIEWKTTDSPYIQMRFAYAIITAYAVIEELGLGIEATKENPSMLANGTWNPKVLENLLCRLKKSNINIDDHISWMIRGEETENEKKKLIISRKTEWADTYENENEFFNIIKDGYVYLPHAINYISYLRSRIASHKVGKRIMSLSVFDVGNAQQLARRLILEKMNLWS